MENLRPFLALVIVLALATTAQADRDTGAAAIESIPSVGDHWLRILSPDILELGAILAVSPGTATTKTWEFAQQHPAKDAFSLIVNGTPQVARIAEVGFRRRPRYAPLNRWELRVEVAVCLRLAKPLDRNDRVEVRLPETLSPVQGARFEAVASDARWSPAIHVSQAGYPLHGPKLARAGYYLGSMGELSLADSGEFFLKEASSGKVVFRSKVQRGHEKGFTYSTPPNEQVAVLDFTAFGKEGVYRLGIDGIGESYPIRISAGYHACLARTYALGLYHQRCGCKVGLPFSRFQHAPCHVLPARVPDAGDSKIWNMVRKISERDNEDQTAPSLNDARSAIYPFRRTGEIDVSGGHHDAGDYSKYVIDSAQLINALTFAVDAFTGVSEIDNLGIPESGNGIPDALDIAAWEAVFLAKMQDSDGGFFFLVYPRERAYETDVTPERGDRQTVFPKNTAATAAASAALCQLASSPQFRMHYPDAAARYLQQATLGWRFLEQAWKKHGERGAYQTISHYGDRFADRDETAWLATELYLATRAARYHDYILKKFKPGGPETRHWGWLRMQESYGAAVRSYVFAAKTGRIPEDRLHKGHWTDCRRELHTWAIETKDYTDSSAYGVAFPFESKRFRTAGWFFAGSKMFDLAAADADWTDNPNLFRKPMASNMAYELGANAVNVCFLTGLGYKRPFEIVHQWSLNDQALLPPSGIPVGSLQHGFRRNHRYEKLLDSLTFPADGANDAPYSFYHRWSDTYNLATEFTIVQQARGLAAMLQLMAKSPLRSQPWTAQQASITRNGEHYALALPETLDPAEALIVWESDALRSPQSGPLLRLPSASPNWITAEALWPDGRRVFAQSKQLDHRRAK